MEKEARYFFTKPTCALWMHENHGLKYESEDGLYIDYHEADNAWRYCAIKIREERGDFTGPKFFVRTGGKKVLEPCDGDLGRDRLGMICWYLDDQWEFDRDLEDESAFQIAFPVSILIRQGTPFIYPEVMLVEKTAVNKTAATGYSAYRYIAGQYTIPEVMTDIRPIKNIARHAVEVKAPNGITIKLLQPEEVFELPNTQKKVA